jgi:hypothetical protein
MTHTNKVVTTASISLLLIGLLSGIWIGYSFKSTANITSIPQAAPPLPTITDADQRIALLEQQIQSLRAENDKLMQHQTHEINPTHLPLSTAAASVTNDEAKQLLQNKLQALEQEKHLRKANDVNNWIMHTPAGFDLGRELSQRFELEARNPLWAEQQENRYQQLFSSQAELRDFALHSAQCRSTQCEVVVSTTNSEQFHLLLQTISQSLHDSEILVTTDAQSGTSKLYISSSEKGFEFN